MLLAAAAPVTAAPPPPHSQLSSHAFAVSSFVLGFVLKLNQMNNIILKWVYNNQIRFYFAPILFWVVYLKSFEYIILTVLMNNKSHTRTRHATAHNGAG